MRWQSADYMDILGVILLRHDRANRKTHSIWTVLSAVSAERFMQVAGRNVAAASKLSDNGRGRQIQRVRAPRTQSPASAVPRRRRLRTGMQSS